MSIGMVIVMEEANKLKSYGAGALAILILLGLMVALVTVGGGRDHT